MIFVSPLLSVVVKALETRWLGSMSRSSLEWLGKMILFNGAICSPSIAVDLGGIYPCFLRPMKSAKQIKTQIVNRQIIKVGV